jgi:two-component system, OmpR family, sensor kinase
VGKQPPDAVVEKDADVETLRRRVAELTEAVAARDTFIAVAAHELRNPMTPIIGHIELLLSRVRAGRCPSEQVEQQLERIQHTVSRYMKRTSILLDISRITSGNPQLEAEPFDLATLLREVADEFADAAQRVGVAITVTAPDSLPGTWDRLAMEQIVDNLISNALKYGGRTPIELSANAGGGRVHVQVRDHGSGIPAAERARVFGRFERAVGEGERRSGFGVGLWLVRQLAEAMGGTISLDDAPGGGALFTVTLPQHMGEARP